MNQLKFPEIKAMIFDVQGTATDFRSTLAEEAARLSRGRAGDIDWGSFVDTWRGMYRPALDEVLAGTRPWTSVDLIYREALDLLLDKKELSFFSEAERVELNFAWQKIRPWPDAVAGLERLKKRYKIATLSNADVSAVVNIAKYGGLPFDAIFAAEMAGTFKPDPRTYQLAVKYLGLKPEQVMMVACHKYDLHAAKSLGLRTAFVARPLEFGPEGKVDVSFSEEFDVNAIDFLDLADQLDL
jgi:2-haloacid dehalogenase